MKSRAVPASASRVEPWLRRRRCHRAQPLMTINAQNAMLISSSTSEQCLADGVALRQQVGEAQGGVVGSMAVFTSLK